MFTRLVSTENMSHEEWLAFRKNGLGGSDAAVACGLSKYKSPVELWMEKKGNDEPKEAGEAAYWGTVMEPHIREEFALRTGLEVKLERSILQHQEHEFMFANVDGIVDDPAHGLCIFEAKTANAFLQDQWAETIPDAYHLQVQHYMAVTDFPAAYVAVLIGGNTFRWYYIPRDNDLIALLIRLETRFWQYVTTNTPPQIDGSEASTELLSRLYSSSTSSSIALPESALELIQQFEEASEKEKQASTDKDQAANQLKDLLKENESGTVSGRTVSWKTISSDRIDSKLLKSEQPDIYAKYTKASSSRRFSVK
jgi:putative phage-type endonuclease